MKILHTADWHLGQKFHFKSREKEHQFALDWLLEAIQALEIDLLIVAGDIFDMDNPPNYARKLYYNFLQRLNTTCCQEVVIVAGNHDSANMLEAPKDLLQLFRVHVVGHITDDRSEQIIEIKDKEGNLKAVVGAVPYLRDRDIRHNVAGETSEERASILKRGIRQHYEEIETELAVYQDKNVPIIVTGHLFAAGGDRGDRINRIHIGSLDVIDASSFSEQFDYVALGHLHRVQQIDKSRPIWYSGALIPLDFSELNYQQSVILVEFEGKQITNRKSIAVALQRKLRHYKGDLEYIKAKLSNLDTAGGLPTWLKLEVDTDLSLTAIGSDLEEILKDKSAEIILLQKPRNTAAQQAAAEQLIVSLQDLDTLQVFEQCIEQTASVSAEEVTELKGSFKELLSWMQERDEE